MYENYYVSILTYLKDKGRISISIISINDIEINEMFDILLELDSKEFVSISIGQVEIMPKGKSYLRMVKTNTLSKETPLVNIDHLGNIIHGNAYSSDLSIDMSRDKQITNNKTQASKPTKSLFDWIIIIIGLLGSIIGIYWFLTK